MAASRADNPEPVRPTRRHFLLLAIGWTAFVVYGSLVPLHYYPQDLATAIARFRSLPPLSFEIGTRADWSANIVLFIPLTFLWMGALVCDRRLIARIAAALAVVPLGAMTSVGIEFAQLWFDRDPALNDIVAESTGGVIGVLLWLGVGQAITRWARTYTTITGARSQIYWLLQAYVLGFIIFSVLPLDLTISVTDLYYKYRSGHVVLIPFAFPYESAAAVAYQFSADIVLFVPLGAWLAERSRRRSKGASVYVEGLIGGLGISAAIEFAQFLVLSRYTDTTDIVLGTLGVMIGVHLHNAGASADSPSRERPVLLETRSWQLAVAILGYSLFLTLGFLFPFDVSVDKSFWRPRVDQFLRVPFTALYWGSVFNATTQLLVRLALFAPLGALFGVVANRARTAGGRGALLLFGLAYASVLAFALEAAEMFMPSKVSDITEVLICAAGAAIGLVTSTRLLAGSRSRRSRALD